MPLSWDGFQVLMLAARNYSDEEEHGELGEAFVEVDSLGLGLGLGLDLGAEVGVGVVRKEVALTNPAGGRVVIEVTLRA